MEEKRLEMLKQLAAGIAAQFGPNCEVVVHEISDKSAYSSIAIIRTTPLSTLKTAMCPAGR